MNPRSLLFASAWLAGLGALFWSGTDPDYYIQYVEHPPPGTYPLEDVRPMALEFTTAALVLLFVLRPWNYRNSWGRALCGLIIAIGMTGVAIGGVQLHAPYSTWIYFHVWLAASACLLIVALWSSVVAYLKRPDV